MVKIQRFWVQRFKGSGGRGSDVLDFLTLNREC